MCFHFVIEADAKQLEEFYRKHFPDQESYEIYHHANGFNNPEMAVALNDKIEMMAWGLVPPWVKDMESAQKIMPMTLNARSETVFSKPSFKMSIIKNRCLIPATGWYEWMHFGKNKIPFLISLKDDPVFSFGGVSAKAVLQDSGEVIRSFSIVTTPANDMMSLIHNNKKRMPLVIPKNLYDAWLDPELSKNDINKIMSPFDDSKMQAHTISKLITSRKEPSNVPEVKNPLEYDEIQELNYIDGIWFNNNNPGSLF